MNAFNSAIALNNFAADVAANQSDRFENLANIEEISASALAFARQLNAVAVFFEALSVGNDAKLNGAL